MTSKETISEWFDRGVDEGYMFMIVYCDTFDHTDYPCYIRTVGEFWHAYYNPPKMSRIMEVYDLAYDKESQLNESRAMHVPLKEELQKTINKKDYWALKGLIEVGKKYDSLMEELEGIGLSITKETDSDGNPYLGGHTSDIIYGGRDLDDGLRILGIKVED